MSSYSGSSPNAEPSRPIYVPVPMQPRPSLLGRLFSLIQWLVFGFFLLAMLVAVFNREAFQTDPDNPLEERYHSLARDGAFKVAIIDVEGAILDADGVKKQVDKVRADDHVKAVVLRIDSPGGLVTASDQAYHYLRKLVEERKLPLVVSMGGMAASGGYYVAMACGDAKDVVFAEPTTWTGSIGVIIPHYSVAGLMEKLSIEEDSIKSGPLKQVGSITRKMTPEERAVLESLVKDSFERFKAIVLKGRPALKDKPELLAQATTGQVFTVEQARKLHLVDREGFIEDAIDRALELAGLDRKTAKVVRYHKPHSLVDALVGASAPKRSVELQMLADLATPRAYYLFAWPQAAQ